MEVTGKLAWPLDEHGRIRAEEITDEMTLVQQLEVVREAIPKLYPDDGSIIMSAEQMVSRGAAWCRNYFEEQRKRSKR